MKTLITRIAGLTVATVMMTTPVASIADTASVQGTFTGASDHVTTGGVSVMKTAGGATLIVLDTDFSLDGAPDAHVALGKNGAFDASANLGKLEKIDGLQVYTVPASTNIDNYNEVYIWCMEFAVPLGVAKLQ